MTTMTEPSRDEGPCWLCKRTSPIAEPFAVVDGVTMNPIIKAPVWACDAHMPASDNVIAWRRCAASQVR